MEQLLDCIMELGEQMLVSGAEVHRVEDSLKRIFCAYGMRRTDVFIITSSMIVTIHTPDAKILTQTRRITETITDFERNGVDRVSARDDDRGGIDRVAAGDPPARRGRTRIYL